MITSFNKVHSIFQMAKYSGILTAYLTDSSHQKRLLTPFPILRETPR
jgi:hypothetical protein